MKDTGISLLCSVLAFLSGTGGGVMMVGTLSLDMLLKEKPLPKRAFWMIAGLVGGLNGIGVIGLAKVLIPEIEWHLCITFGLGMGAISIGTVIGIPTIWIIYINRLLKNSGK